MSSIAVNLTSKDDDGNVVDNSEHDVPLTAVDEIVNLSADIAIARREGKPLDELLTSLSDVLTDNNII